MIKFIKEKSFLLLRYTPDRSDVKFVHKYLEKDDFRLQRTFFFVRDNLYKSLTSEENITFHIATLDNDYYKFDNDILNINFNLYIHESINIDRSFFIAKGSYNISIFKALSNVISHNQNMYIGGNENDNMSLEDFQNLLKEFPTSTELEKYKYSRITLAIKEHMDIKESYEEKYQKYMNKKISKTGVNLNDIIKEYETDKYQLVLQKLKDMLNHESSYNEAHWQKEILQIIKLIYPKYVSVLEEVTMKNSYDGTEKRLDLVLVDSNGNIDIVEIKKPFGDKGILSKGQYRDNYVPKRELSGSIMQVEKYIFYLNKFTKKQEQDMTDKYKDELPKNLNIQVINPKGFIIVGRDSDFGTKQREDDFEIIKRKYKNIIDIITYDDLIRRIENIINSFKLIS